MRLAFEGVLVLLLLGVTLFMIGVPVIKLLRLAFPKKTDSLAEAKIRLETAKKDAEAARLNKETEKVYSELYDDVLNDNEDERHKKL
jgi:hypothetical protein